LEKELFVEQKIDWTKVPTLSDLEKAQAKYVSNEFAIKKRKGKLQLTVETAKIRPSFKFEPDEYVTHKTKNIDEVKEMYNECGFDTKVILQDPFGHKFPCAACPIGFPFAFPKVYPELLRYSRWICRIHVEIASDDKGNIVSVPHIEPDPCFHAAAHIIDTYLKGNVVRGKVAVEFLKRITTDI
jgi:hypothetical protein